VAVTGLDPGACSRKQGGDRAPGCAGQLAGQLPAHGADGFVAMMPAEGWR
jgi:hypothetical protein